jgi:hypothetical protein
VRARGSESQSASTEAETRQMMLFYNRSLRAGTRATFLGDPTADKPGGLFLGFDLTPASLLRTNHSLGPWRSE